MLGIGTQEMARMHQDELGRGAAVLHMAAGGQPAGWRRAAGTALVRLGTRLSGATASTGLAPVLTPPGRLCG